MKKNVFVLKIFVLFAVFAVLFSCKKNDDDAGGSEDSEVEETLPNITELATDINVLSDLVDALDIIDADVTELLSNENGLQTIFAPTNDAFTAFFNELEGFETLSDFDEEEEIALLTEIIKYHIISSTTLYSSDLSNEQELTTLQGEAIIVIIDGEVHLQDKTSDLGVIVNADNEASNGVVHLIDKILLSQAVLDILYPKPSIIELVVETEELSLFAQAIQTAGIEDDLNADGPFTVFAPTDAAIEELLVLLGDQFNGFEDFDNFIEIELLKRILLFHVIEGNFTSSELVAGEVSTLFSDNSITIIASEDSFVIDDATNVNANIITTDKLASNGTVHIIDKILIPEEALEFLEIDDIPDLPANSTIKELVETTEEFSFLREALSLTGLLDTLGEDGPFTVFAPDNDTLVGLFGLLGSQFSSLQDFVTEEDISLLRDILAYHILGEQLNSADLASKDSLNTLSGSNTIEVVNSEETSVLSDALVANVNFILTDIPAENGIIHTVDRILIPESVISHIENQVALAFESVMLSAGDLTTVLELFRIVQNRMDLENLADKEFTFFFPSDQAFIDLFDDIGLAKFEQITDEEEGIEILKTILSYHCVEVAALKASDFEDQQSLATFQGEELEVLLNEDVFIIDKTALPSKIIQADLGVLNGNIHVVDKVLLPQEIIDELAL